MLKARATGPSGPLYILGLSEGNLRLLREGKPIFFEMAELGASGQMLIYWGPTEAAMKEELGKFMTFDMPEKQ